LAKAIIAGLGIALLAVVGYLAYGGYKLKLQSERAARTRAELEIKYQGQLVHYQRDLSIGMSRSTSENIWIHMRSPTTSGGATSPRFWATSRMQAFVTREGYTCLWNSLHGKNLKHHLSIGWHKFPSNELDIVYRAQFQKASL